MNIIQTNHSIGRARFLTPRNQTAGALRRRYQPGKAHHSHMPAAGGRRQRDESLSLLDAIAQQIAQQHGGSSAEYRRLAATMLKEAFESMQPVR
jgi:hypothetical protein